MEQVASSIAPADLPVVTWRGQCTMALHGCTDFWDVQAATQYTAAVQLRAQLSQEGRIMPADLVWTAI